MTKTLTISVEDIEKSGTVSISGALHEHQFNEVVVLTVGNVKVALNSKELATCLAEVVNFQSKFEVKNEVTSLFTGTSDQ